MPDQFSFSIEPHLSVVLRLLARKECKGHGLEWDGVSWWSAHELPPAIAHSHIARVLGQAASVRAKQLYVERASRAADDTWSAIRHAISSFDDAALLRLAEDVLEGK